MKALHVIPSISGKHGGPSAAVRSYAEAAIAGGVEVLIATTKHDEEDLRVSKKGPVHISENGIDIIYFDCTTRIYKTSIPLGRWLGHHLAEFDLLHIHALFSFSSTAAAWIARRRAIPYIVRPLGVLNRWGLSNRRAFAKKLSLPMIERQIVRGAAAMHYTGEQERAEAIEALPELSDKRSIILSVPLTKEAFNTGDARLILQQYPELAGKEIILFLSRIDPKKGLDLLLPAFRDVLAQHKGAHLVIAGDGEPVFVEGLKELAANLGMTQAVTWTGWLAGEVKRSALAAASVFVLPSHSENFGVAAAESLAAGVPTIVSEEVGLSDDICKWNAGVVVPSDRQQLAGAIGDVLSDKDKAALLAANGKNLAQKCYSLEAIRNRLFELYQDIV